MNDFEKAWAAFQDRRRIGTSNEQAFRHGWNAAVAAAETIVADKRDPGEPWLDPGDLTEALEVEVQT
jgi:hypothetical protein